MTPEMKQALEEIFDELEKMTPEEFEAAMEDAKKSQWYEILKDLPFAPIGDK